MFISNQPISVPQTNFFVQDPNNDPISAYKSLDKKLEEVKRAGKKQLSKPVSLYVLDESDQLKKEFVVKSLGRGGCKKAVQLADGRALLIPNMDSNVAEGVNTYWPHVVSEEVQMSKYLQEIGLLGLKLEKVTIFPRKGSSFPSYVTDSFASLKEKNIYIIDQKNDESSTWDKKLFANREDRENLEKWKPLIDPLVKDIAKLALYNLPLSGDSLNLAIVKNEDDYQIRYFGFDFTGKTSRISMPGGFRKLNIDNMSKNLSDDLRFAFSAILWKVLFAEYSTGGFQLSLSDDGENLKKRLIETYSKNIFDEIHNLQI